MTDTNEPDCHNGELGEADELKFQAGLREYCAETMWPFFIQLSYIIRRTSKRYLLECPDDRKLMAISFQAYRDMLVRNVELMHSVIEAFVQHTTLNREEIEAHVGINMMPYIKLALESEAKERRSA